MSTSSAAPAATRQAAPERPDTAVRTDIQALRAVAVSIVLLYHLFPGSLTGGFTGVDVFFVISGFLITSHLLSHPPSRPRDLFTFWSRRIRRLLPASLLVLMCVLIASRLVAPETAWGNTAKQARSAALYVLNWRLANDSVDYLASQDAPTPVQHFWSLSVEEQFYLGWPVLILVLALIARLIGRRVAAIVSLGLAAVVAASFWYSVVETAVEPARAYFVTTTRVWELGVGGLLASLLAIRAPAGHRAGHRAGDRGGDRAGAIPLPAPARIGLAWIGLALIAYAAVAYSGSTPFPSWRAAVPVLGTAAVIAAWAPRAQGSPAGVMALPPLQWLGNISYSLYLWHWPLIVLVPAYLGHDLGLVDKLGVLVASLALADLTKRLVEDRFRTPAWGRPLAKPYLLGAAAMGVVVVAATLQNVAITHSIEASLAATKVKAASGDPCFGAAAIVAPAGRCPVTRSGTLYPSPLAVAADKTDAWAVGDRKGCQAHRPTFRVVTCVAGPADAPVDIALVGNSHAAQWYPAVKEAAAAHGWHVTLFIASQCALADMLQDVDTPAHARACLRWGRHVQTRLLTGGFDLVVMADRISVTALGQDGYSSSLPVYEQGYESVLRTLSAAHQRVLAIRDTPAPGFPIPDCLAAHAGDYAQCDGTLAAWLPPDPLVKAVRAVHDPRITSTAMTPYLCESQRCQAVVGGVPVYFDGSHLSSTYARTLGPFLDPKMQAALAVP